MKAFDQFIDAPAPHQFSQRIFEFLDVDKASESGERLWDTISSWFTRRNQGENGEQAQGAAGGGTQADDTDNNGGNADAENGLWLGLGRWLCGCVMFLWRVVGCTWERARVLRVQSCFEFEPFELF